jgi:hypothetical protein
VFVGYEDSSALVKSELLHSQNQATARSTRVRGEANQIGETLGYGLRKDNQ